MTSQQWIQSLIRQREFTIDSSKGLVDRVKRVNKSKTFHGHRKQISSVPEYQTAQIMKVSILELLWNLGKITTPRIPNLVDLASTWAIIRYIWVFDPDLAQTDLVLSNYSRNLDFHQKAVLSDDLGVAFSSYIVRKYFGGIWPQPVSIAVRKQNPSGIRLKYNTSPDYIFKSSGGGYIVVECKGTITGKQTTINQLGRGREQIPSVTIGSSQTLGLITGACMMKNHTTVFIIDPPEKEDFGSDENKFFISNPEQFDKELETMYAADQLRFAGLDELAQRIISPITMQKDEVIYDRKLSIVKRETIDTFNGISSPDFYLGNGLSARIFKGISNSIVQGFNEGTETGLKTMRSYKDYFGSQRIFIKNINDRSWPLIIPKDNSVNIISEDGSMMSIEVNES